MTKHAPGAFPCPNGHPMDYESTGEVPKRGGDVVISGYYFCTTQGCTCPYNRMEVDGD